MTVIAFSQDLTQSQCQGAGKHYRDTGFFKDSSTLAGENHLISTELSVKKIQISNILASLNITQPVLRGWNWLHHSLYN